MALLLDFLHNCANAKMKSHGPRIIVARPKMNPADMPDGARLVRRKVGGERVIVKDRRYYGNTRNFKAKWPDAGLDEREMYSAVCVLSGHADFQIGHYAVQCGEGVFIILPPGTPQPDGRNNRFHAENSVCELLTIILHPHAVQCFITRSHPEQNRVEFLENYLFQNYRLAVLFRLLVEEMNETQKLSHDIAVELLSAFWLVLQREMQERHYINPGPVGRPPVPQKRAGFEAELLSYIQIHLKQPLTLESVARGLYLSRTQFVRRMREETGKTFVQYLTDYRVDEARALLRDSDWTINAIAEFLGFRSATYFQAVFRRATGQSPTEFRAQQRPK